MCNINWSYLFALDDYLSVLIVNSGVVCHNISPEEQRFLLLILKVSSGWLEPVNIYKHVESFELRVQFSYFIFLFNQHRSAMAS